MSIFACHSPRRLQSLFTPPPPPPPPSSHFEQRTQRSVLCFGFPAAGAASSRAPCRRAIMAACVQGEVFSVTSTNSDVDYLGESTKGDLNVNQEHLEAFGFDGQASLDGPIEEIARVEAKEAKFALNALGIVDPFSLRNSSRGIFCSRTLNLRSIGVIGYDMDYTLIHYNVM